MYSAKLMMALTIILLFIISSLYYYFTRDDVFLIWNTLPSTIQINQAQLSPQPFAKEHPPLKSTMHYYHRFGLSLRKYVYSYFDFHHFQRYNDIMTGVQFQVHYQGHTYLLGCPKTYNNKRLTLAKIQQHRKTKGIVAVCMPMDTHRFLTLYPEEKFHSLHGVQKAQKRLSDSDNRIMVFSTHKMGLIEN